MSWQPMIIRELRVASRRKWTYRMRLWVGLVCAFVAIFMLMSFEAGVGGPSAGRHVFGTLAWIGFAVALLSGVFIASDCISEEFRDGTIGLLFLTHLSGTGVVLGKFAALMLPAAFGLLSCFPVLGMSLLAGGVAGLTFWKVVLALMVALFYSMSAGIWISSRNVDERRAQTGAFVVVVGLPVVLLLFEALRAGLGFPGWAGYLQFVNPLAMMNAALSTGGAGSAEYGRTLSGVLLLSVLVLAHTCWALPRTWRRKLATENRAHRVLPAMVRGRRAKMRSKKRAELLDRNPVEWLIPLAGGVRALTWVVVILGVLVNLLMIFTAGDVFGDAMGMWFPVAWIFGLMLKMIFCGQACSFFAEARRTNAIQLLLATPLTGRRIVSGVWASLRRVFLLPLCVYLGGLLACLVVIPVVQLSSDAGFEILFASAMQLIWVLDFGVDILAIGWLGMYLSLSLKKPSRAAGWTFLIVVFLANLVCVTGGALVVNVVILLVFRQKLLTEFRIKALPDYEPGRVPAPPIGSRFGAVHETA